MKSSLSGINVTNLIKCACVHSALKKSPSRSKSVPLHLPTDESKAVLRASEDSTRKAHSVSILDKHKFDGSDVTGDGPTGRAATKEREEQTLAKKEGKTSIKISRSHKKIKGKASKGSVISIKTTSILDTLCACQNVKGKKNGPPILCQGHLNKKSLKLKHGTEIKFALTDGDNHDEYMMVTTPFFIKISSIAEDHLSHKDSPRVSFQNDDGELLHRIGSSRTETAASPEVEILQSHRDSLTMVRRKSDTTDFLNEAMVQVDGYYPTQSFRPHRISSISNDGLGSSRYHYLMQDASTQVSEEDLDNQVLTIPSATDFKSREKVTIEAAQSDEEVEETTDEITSWATIRAREEQQKLKDDEQQTKSQEQEHVTEQEDVPEQKHAPEPEQEHVPEQEHILEQEQEQKSTHVRTTTSSDQSSESSVRDSALFTTSDVKVGASKKDHSERPLKLSEKDSSEEHVLKTSIKIVEPADGNPPEKPENPDEVHRITFAEDDSITNEEKRLTPILRFDESETNTLPKGDSAISVEKHVTVKPEASQQQLLDLDKSITPEESSSLDSNKGVKRISWSEHKRALGLMDDSIKKVNEEGNSLEATALTKIRTVQHAIEVPSDHARESGSPKVLRSARESVKRNAHELYELSSKRASMRALPEKEIKQEGSSGKADTAISSVDSVPGELINSGSVSNDHIIQKNLQEINFFRSTNSPIHEPTN